MVFSGYTCRGITSYAYMDMGLLAQGHKVTGTQVDCKWCRGIGLLVQR